MDPLLSLGQVAEATAGRLVGEPETALTSVSTDSRSLPEGALFVAICGDRFDGHRFCEGALAAGAAGLLVSEAEAIPAGGSAVVVEDTLEGLQRLGAWHRRRLASLIVTGLTGSAGKTTTKELVAAILGQRFRTLATKGNLNNHIGVPLTLLELGAEHERAVVEMGCNAFGEIAMLAGLARPDVALVTNVGEAHLEGLGSLDGVARAKGELFEALEPEHTAVVNLDDPRVAAMPTRAKRMGYGRSESAEVRLLESRPRGDGRLEVVLDILGERVEASLSLLGEHNARNATAAAALATAAGAKLSDVVEGLAKVAPTPGRLCPRAGRAGLRLIDDTYNANPGSMELALGVLRDMATGAGSHALLGEMLELGDASESSHRRVGRRAAEIGVATLVAVGAAAEPLRAGALAAGLPEDRFLSVETPEEAAAAVLERVAAGDVVLAKGSRGAHMERAVSALLEEGA